MKRFDLVFGKNDGYAYARREERDNGEYVRYEDAQAEIAHWKANHDNVVERLRLFTQRKDLPVDRVDAYKSLTKAQEEVARLEGLCNELLDGLQYASEKLHVVYNPDKLDEMVG